MRRKSARTMYEFAACVLHSPGAAGFALPLLRGPGSSWYAQEIDEITDSIRGCLPVEGEIPDVIRLPAALPMRIGTEARLCFVDDEGVPHLGSRREIRKTVETYCNAHPERLELRLQLAFLGGDSERRRTALIAMSNAIRSDRRSDNEYQFKALQRSALRARLWDRLLEAASDVGLAQRILAKRPLLDAELDCQGNVVLSLHALSTEDLSSLNISTIQAEMEKEFRDCARETARPVLQRELFESDTDQLPLEGLARANRQEERIALVFNALLQNPSDGKRLLKNYTHDRASFATQMIKLLEVNASNNQLSELDLIQALDRALVKVFPMNRGELFYYLAKHLGKYPAFNSFLTKRLEDYKSIYVERVRSIVVDVLAKSTSNRSIED